MAKLQVTISHRLAQEFLDLMRHTYEASDYPMDDELEADYEAFSTSVKRAVQRQSKAEQWDRVMARARAATKSEAADGRQ